MNLVKVEVKRKVPNSEALVVYMDGKIRMSKGLCEKLKVTPGMRVDFFQDTEKEKNWFVQFSETGTFELRSYEHQNCIVYNKAMAEKIRKHFFFQSVKPIQCKLSDAVMHENKTYYQILYIG